jgi:hypothetical protein
LELLGSVVDNLDLQSEAGTLLAREFALSRATLGSSLLDSNFDRQSEDGGGAGFGAACNRSRQSLDGSVDGAADAAAFPVFSKRVRQSPGPADTDVDEAGTAEAGELREAGANVDPFFAAVDPFVLMTAGNVTLTSKTYPPANSHAFKSNWINSEDAFGLSVQLPKPPSFFGVGIHLDSVTSSL